MSNRFRLVPEVHLFLLDRDSRVLLLRRCNTDYENVVTTAWLPDM